MCRGSRILVTGSEGFIGAVLVPLLLQQGYAVDGADIGWFESNATGNDFLNLDINTLKQYDAVIHLAGLSDDKLCDAFPDKAETLNVTQVVALADRCKQAGVGRFVLASSAAVYGNTNTIATEDATPNPETVYSRGKLRAEQQLIERHGAGFEVVCLRFGSGYGVSPKPRKDLVVNRLAQRALTEGNIGLTTSGESFRPFVHVYDMAAALVHAATDKNVASRYNVFNVSHPEGNVTVTQAVEQLAAVSGAAVNEPLPEIDQRSYRIDPARFMATGFSYQWSMADGLDLLVRQLRYEQSRMPEQDRIARLETVFGEAANLTTAAAGTALSIGAVTPSRLTSPAHTAYLDDLGKIISRSSYRLTGAHSCAAADLLATEYSANSDQRVLMMRSGTDALMRALQVLGVKAGDRVAMPDQCFHAVAVSVLTLGAIPVFVDTRSDDFNLDADKLDETITSNPVKAVIAVDNYGTPADWKKISEVARKHGVPFIVDACESLGATRTGQEVVHYADTVVVSFSFTKPIHAAGMGGALIADKSLTDIIETDESYLFRQIRLPEINAAYLVRAWEKLHANIDHLRDIYQQYSQVAAATGFTAQHEHGISTRIHAPFLLPVGWPAAARDELIQTLQSQGVGAGNQFAAQSYLLAGHSNLSTPGHRCPVSEDTSSRVITLPTGGGLDQIQVDAVKQRFEAIAQSMQRQFHAVA